AIEPGVARLIHLTHTAGAKRLDDFIWSEPHPWSGAHEDRILQPSDQVVIQQTMKKVLAGFAPDREAPGGVGARMQAALDRHANGDILVLNLLADRDALQVVRASALRVVCEVEVEDHLRAIRTAR